MSKSSYSSAVIICVNAYVMTNISVLLDYDLNTNIFVTKGRES